MKYIVLLIIIIFSESISAQCTDSIDQPRIIEEMPSCFNCCSIIEKYINNNIDNFDLTGLEKIDVCFQINPDGKVSNTYVIGITNPNLVSVIDNGLKSVSTFSPAKMRNVPIQSQWRFTLSVSDNHKSVKLLCFIHEITELEYNTKKQIQNSQNLFKTNSDETISYLHLSSLSSYIVDSISGKGKYSSSFISKNIKTTRLKIEGIESKQEGVIIIPELKYKKTVHSDNYKVLDFGEIPTGKEVVLVILRKTQDKIYIFIDKFIFNGTKGLSFEGKEYSFRELNQEINILEQEVKQIWPRR